MVYPVQTSPLYGVRQQPAPVIDPRVLIFDARKGGFYYKGQKLAWLGSSGGSGGADGYMNPDMDRVRKTGPLPKDTLYEIGPFGNFKYGMSMYLTGDASKMTAT